MSVLTVFFLEVQAAYCMVEAYGNPGWSLESQNWVWFLLWDTKVKL